MKSLSFVFAVAIVAGVATAPNVYAQAAAAPTGVCKDGTSTSSDTKKGACAGHGGVKTWTGAKKSDAAAPSAKAAAATPAATPAPKSTAGMVAPAAAAATPSAMAATPAKTAKKAEAMPTVAAAGGGPGKVWVNSSTHVYHCMGDEYYGKTKAGAYMSEADAKAKGAHAAAGKACS